MGILGDMSEFLTGTLVLSVLLIVIGLAYFLITLWTVKTGAGLLELTPDANWVVFSASVIAAASIIGSSKRNY
ncbi:MAG: hypothetical protein GOV01_02325 [Candidatus Altiarchaeota archaeon]|nr:hypothetical protein [Candidatus Altiarchaeota archaeon]